ncbi:hypothetical protein EVAR_72134_1 [Eumeta japonica]|uniref:Uncharacterized protein n=1 Tax=Eumeta variegata TaxID=151549 RepID=A0A4C1SRM1_EUMVA|nr:hypothetical protein EVAR_72134_1 [Eumeta japonica]
MWGNDRAARAAGERGDDRSARVADPPTAYRTLRARNEWLLLIFNSKGCVRRLTLPWRGYKSTVALNVQRFWGVGIERDRARVNEWHSNACA